MKHRMRWLGIAVIATAVLSGCTKDPLNHINDDESRLYITNHDSTADFAAYHTFSVADSVAVIVNNQLKEKSTNAFDQQLISETISRMEQQGYTWVSRDDNPDLVINISRVYNDYTGLIDYSNYYGGYYGYFDPYYWGYPGYSWYFPPIYGVYTLRDGGINLDMFDAKDAQATGELRLVWNGLIRGTGTFNEANILGNIRSLFDQSSYLRSNG